MCPPLTFGTAKKAVKQRILWFTAITAADKDDLHSARSENYLAGVRAMVLSALRNSPSLVPVVLYLGGRKGDCFVSWLTQQGAYVMVVDRLSFMSALPGHATDHSSASMANHGAFAILDTPRFWTQVRRIPSHDSKKENRHYRCCRLNCAHYVRASKMWREFRPSLEARGVDPAYALYTDADM